MKRETTGTAGWCALGIGVLAFDLLAPETLSHACHRGMEHPTGRFLLTTAIGGVALHLLGVLPTAVDPFYQLHLEKLRPS